MDPATLTGDAAGGESPLVATARAIAGRTQPPARTPTPPAKSGQKPDDKATEVEEVEETGDKGGKTEPDEEISDGHAQPIGREKSDDAGEDKGGEKGEEQEGHSIEIPTLEAIESDGEKGHALKLEGLPQEFADTIRAHIKRSVRVGQLEGQVAELGKHETVVRFFESQPLAGMHWIEKQDPEIGATFTRSWIERHPQDAVKLFAELKLRDADPEILQLRADKAQRDADDKIRDGFSGLHEDAAVRQYANESAEVILGFADKLQLSTDDARDFAEMCKLKLVAAVKAREAARQPAYLGREDIVKVIAPMVKRFGGSTEAADQNGKGKPAKPGEKKTLTREEIEAKAARAQQLQRQSRGQGAVRPGSTQRIKKGADLKETIAAYRGAQK